MKKLFFKIFLYLLLILFTLLITEILLRRIPNQYNTKRKYLDQHSDKMKGLILGSSHGVTAYDTSGSIHRLFNAAHSNQSLDYDFEILKKYKGKWACLEYIILPVSYGSLFYKIETSAEPWRAKNYIIYYDIIISDNLRYHTEVMNGILRDKFIRLFGYYFKRKGQHTFSGLRSEVVDTVKLKESGIEAVKRQTAPVEWICMPEMKIILDSIVNFAKSIDVNIIMITTPFYISYVENMQESQFYTTINIIKEVVERNENCYYFNLINDKVFREEDFWDGDHLSETGTKKLTLKIDSLIDNLNPQVRFNNSFILEK